MKTPKTFEEKFLSISILTQSIKKTLQKLTWNIITRILRGQKVQNHHLKKREECQLKNIIIVHHFRVGSK